ncbi:TRAP transporter small permease [Jannaschia pohangensis]|uniref:TRAP transporter small permease protein n=1 Tax=Jannaschia pohangensis TaxID=390807 RepID=A0A1I3RCJ5_9RHOB|nr:TRAP transporter small permease subunit [Jannaschia pohangensis]SFJ43071.1 TRAP-type C4-dicarboxylate transport system, small permease component [Jannaschia pohangensis]
MEIFGGIGEIISALFANDAWTLGDALRQNQPATWTLGLLATILGGLAMFFVYRFVPMIERHLEPTVMVVSYLMIGFIIFESVVQRFLFDNQNPWSTTLPSFLFLIMTWVGCSYNVKLRTHLAFSEFRTAMPPAGQIFCLLLDALLWTGFAWIVVVTTTQETVAAAANFRFMSGTDNLMQWWFLVSVPIAWTILVARVFENLVVDLRNFRNGAPLIEQAVIGGDT